MFKSKEDYLIQRKALLDSAEAAVKAGDTSKFEDIKNQIDALDGEFDKFKVDKANATALEGLKKVNVALATMKGDSKMDNKITNRAEMLNSIEYREAFMNSVLKGEKMPSQFRNEDQYTTTGDVASVIPTVLVQRIVTKFEEIGKFYALATKTSYKGGVSIPTANFDFAAQWVAERGKSDVNKATTGVVTFTYHKLQVRVAISLEASVTTLDIFETELVNAIGKSMVKKIEQAMFVGEGATAHQPVGILTETPEGGQAIEIAEGTELTYAKLLEVEAALPEGYSDGAVWVMNKKTFYTNVLGMVDLNGQPIARTSVGIDGKPEFLLFGREVMFTEHISALTSTVTKDTIVAAIFNFSDYAINTNYALTVKRYTDEETDDEIFKATTLVDGKAVDKNSLVTLTVKKA